MGTEFDCCTSDKQSHYILSNDKRQLKPSPNVIMQLGDNIRSSSEYNVILPININKNDEQTTNLTLRTITL